MDFLARIVEERIQRAQEAGVFENLPGKGQPLHLEDDSSIPQDLRLAYKILRNSNHLPIEMEMRKEIFSLRQLLKVVGDEEVRHELRRELNLLILGLNIREGRSVSLSLRQI